MNIKLTSQILSSAVGNVLKELGPPEGFGIAEFCVVKDEFFNCFNVQGEQSPKKSEPNLKSYSDVKNERLGWLRNEVLILRMKRFHRRQPWGFYKNCLR